MTSMIKVSLPLLMLCVAVLSIDEFSSHLKPERFRCHEGFSCQDIVCEEITSCLGGRVLKNASYCNCCDTCTMEKNDNPTKCRQDRAIRLERQSNHDEYADDMWIPECDENGYYNLRQKKKKKSICVDINGGKLFGQDDTDSSQNMTCRCAQHISHLQKENSFMTKPQEHCTASGDFDTLQCIGNLCYCANSITGNIEGRLVLIDHIDKLHCYDEENSVTSYLKPCEEELIRALSLRYHFYLKGMDVIGLEKVKCNPDGTFSPLQCDTNRCSCTDENGKQIRSFYAENPKSTLKMITCNCARDNERAATHLQFPQLECGLLYQCFQEERCFCVDEDGDVISKELNKTTADQTFCSKLLENLIYLDEPTSSPQPTTESSEEYDYSDDSQYN